MDFQYRILEGDGHSPTPSKVRKVFERETLGLDLPVLLEFEFGVYGLFGVGNCQMGLLVEGGRGA